MARLTIQEAAAELRCSEKTVRRAIRRGDLRAVMFGGRYLIDPDSLPSYQSPSRVPPPRPRKPGQPGSLTALVDAMDAA